MNSREPNSPDWSGLLALEDELSIEDVARLDDYETIKEEPLEELPEPPAITELTAEEETVAAALPIRPRPITPIPIRPIYRTISGRYRSCPRNWELELRIDVDGSRSMRRISGDYYRISGSTKTYYGSFVVNTPSISYSSSVVRITGIASTTWTTTYNKLQVTVARHNIYMPPAAAHAQWMTRTNRRGSAYTCIYESRYFRSVRYEQDYVRGVTPFTSYDTGLLPSGGRRRTLTVQRAFAEAGIEMQSTGGWNEIPISDAGSDAKWSNAELHAAMVRQFSLWRDVPQWAVWLLAAHLHVYGTGLYGIMFDQQGKQRQGCAVFHAGIGGTTPVKLRDQIYTYVHELGHCFNLFHSFHKRYMTPPMPNRLDSRSWMNYPRNYRRSDGTGGSAAFWNDFAFQFDNLEIVHLRHAFRNNIIMGGNPFGTGAALEDPEAFADPVEDNSGLKLELEAPKSFALGEPVVVEIILRLNDARGKTVHKQTLLHPNFGFVQIGIRKPSGQVYIYEPLMEHCVEAETTMLDSEQCPALYESAYIGYGKDGFYFDQVGVYTLRATYFALDGSEVMSDVMNLRVREPLSSADEEVADLFFGDDQGSLLYLLGSDCEYLESGNNAFAEVLDKHSDHPLAVYAQLVLGTNLGREFKSFTPDREIVARKPNSKESIKYLKSVVTASKGEAGVDNITLNATMRCLADVQKEAGDTKGSKDTLKSMVDIFTKKKFKAHVIDLIKVQAKM